MLTAISRVFNSGFQTFHRNAWLSIATIGIMALMIFVFAQLFVFRYLTRQAIALIEQKIDMSVYFDASVDESGILRARDLISQLPEVANVQYVSRDEALANFRNRHKNNSVLIQALDELNSNPLQASLNIKAKNSEEYPKIVSFIENAPFRNQIAKVNYTENQSVIERLNRLVRGVRNLGVILSLVLAAIAILVSFNTIRMAIYSFREEISIMKLVGSSNWFIRGPFMIAGVLNGLIAAGVSFAVFWLVMRSVSPMVDNFIPGAQFSEFLSNNILSLAVLQAGAGIILGAFSSAIAINKYLNV